MKKLSFNDLSAMAENVATTALLEQISGGTENDCHDKVNTPIEPIHVPAQVPIDNTGLGGYGSWGG